MQIFTLSAEQVDAIDGCQLALNKILCQLQIHANSDFWEVRAIIAEAHWPTYRDQGFARGVDPRQVYAWPGLYKKDPLVPPLFEPVAIDSVLLPGSKKYIDVLRLDTLHPLLMGNKWFKLLYNIQQMKAKGYRRLLSFGGAYSNHLFATAAAGRLLGIPTQAIVRGEPVSNPVLDTARANGMDVDFWSRTAYREKASTLAKLQDQFPDAWIVPEGGGNAEGIRGAQEMWSFFPAVNKGGGNLKRDIFMACGTGSTLAGLLLGCAQQPEDYVLHGVAVLKGGDFLSLDITRWTTEGEIQRASQTKAHLPSWHIYTQFHGGGYARCKTDLRDFLTAFCALNLGFPVEHVYTGKLFWAMDQLLLQDPLLTPENMLALHTGGVYLSS